MAIHTLVASAKKPTAATPVRKVNPNSKVRFSVFAPTNTAARDAYVAEQLKRIESGDLSGRITDKSEFAHRFGATPAALKAAKRVVRKYKIDVEAVNPHSGEIQCYGYVRDVNKMIPNLDLSVVKIGDVEYRARHGAHQINAKPGVITKVMGLDNVPLARTHYRKLEPTVHLAAAAGTKPLASGAFNPFDLMPIFGVQDNLGEGQTIGIIALGGGYKAQDGIDYARNVLKVKGTITVRVNLVDKAKNKPDPGGADVETLLDVDGSLGAPGATIIIAIAPNSDTGFAHGIGNLIDAGCDVITISWGSSESNWTQQGRDAMGQEFTRAFAAGVSVYAAAGDNNAPDSVDDGKVHADFPSSHPLVMSMIGLNLSKDGKKARIWNNGDSGSGGGVSDVYPQEAWEKAGIQVKSLNDGGVRHRVGGPAGPADPATGIIVSDGGKLEVVGGTSADGPLYAGFTARANVAFGKRLGFYLPYIIANAGKNPKLVVPVTDGNNGLGGSGGYTAEQLTPGMVNFTALVAGLKASA